MSSSNQMNLLAIDDDPATLELIQAALERPSMSILTADNGEDGLRLAKKHRPDVVILDIGLPERSGMEVLDDLTVMLPETDVVLLTGDYSTESAVEAIRRGAADYLVKPISLESLRERVASILVEAERRHRVSSLEREAALAHSFQGLVGRSEAMRGVFARIRRIAPHFRSALVLGATGTGKELVSRALHSMSPVAKGPFVVCNCSAIVDSLFESELFGHVKGAFTGAATDKPGFFEAADGGTLMLDELGDLPLPMQPKLLRVIQQQELQRVGSPRTRSVNVRLVGATNRDLKEMMKRGEFREDLYYRLSMVEVALPSLAERREDIPLLVRHFIDHFSEQYGKTIQDITPRAMAILERYSWPGNIRELENVMGNACMMAEGSVIDVEDLPAGIAANGASEPQFPASEVVPLSELERQYARHALSLCDGNKVRTAEALGISRATLYKLIAEEEP